MSESTQAMTEFCTHLAPWLLKMRSTGHGSAFGPFFGFGLLLRTLLEAVIGTICFWHPSRPVIFGKPNVSRVVGSGHTDAYFRISVQLLHPGPIGCHAAVDYFG